MKKMKFKRNLDMIAHNFNQFSQIRRKNISTIAMGHKTFESVAWLRSREYGSWKDGSHPYNNLLPFGLPGLH